MFTYNILIYERNKITSVKVDSLAYTLKLDESLDSGVLTIPRSTRKNKFNRFSRVEITINDGVENVKTTWLIYTTKVEIDSRGTRKTYNHTIGLIEPTKWLEKFVVGTLTFTQPLTGTQKTLYDYIERVRLLVPFVPRNKVLSTRLFRIDNDFKTKLQSVIAPQMYLDKKNLREVLIELCKVVNAIPRLYYDGGWVLTGDFINQRQHEIEIGDGDIDYIQEASGDNFAQSAEVFHENTIPDKDNVIYEGSITDYITFRNNDVILGESDLRLILSQPVSEFTNLYMVIKLDDVTVSKVNINKYLYEKKVYDSLDMESETDESQALAIYWTYKSNEVLGFSETFGAIFPRIAIERILMDLGQDLSWSISTFTNEHIYDLIFQAEYVPYIETMRSVQYRENFEPYALSPDMLDHFSGMLINQGERINELYDLTENVYGQIQRIGVDTVSISKKHYHFSELFNYGDYTTDGYIVTKIEIIPYTTYLIARYELSKNWNRISQFIQIDKEFRPYEVSLTKSAFTLKRDVLMNIGFVEVSNERKLNSDTTDYSNLRTIFMNTFKTGTYLTSNIAAFKLKTPYSIDSLAKPTISVAEKNILKWKIDFNDTKLAGKQVVPDTDSLIGVLSGRRIQKGVYYTNERGELEVLKIYLHNGIYNTSPTASTSEVDITKLIADNLPLVDVSTFPLRLISPIFEMPDYTIKKDSAEVLGLELILPVLPQYNLVDTFVIGDSLLKDNILIKKRTDSKTLWFYGLTQPIEKSKTDKIDLTSATLLSNVSASVSGDTITVNSLIYENYDYFAIADTNGNLYLGVNQVDYSGVKTEIPTIYFNFLNTRAYPPIVLEGDDLNYNQNMIGGFNIGGELDYDIQIFFAGELDGSFTFNANVEFESVVFIQNYISFVGQMNFGATISVTQEIVDLFSTQLSAPMIFGAAIEFYEGQLDWTTSNVTYWNEQNALGNAGTESSNPSASSQPIADAEDYEVGYAIRCSDGSLPVTYYYYKVVNTRR